jgi:hypothetical protein
MTLIADANLSQNTDILIELMQAAHQQKVSSKMQIGYGWAESMILKLTVFQCHAESSGDEASGHKGRNRTGWEARFFAAIQNDRTA